MGYDDISHSYSYQACNFVRGTYLVLEPSVNPLPDIPYRTPLNVAEVYRKPTSPIWYTNGVLTACWTIQIAEGVDNGVVIVNDPIDRPVAQSTSDMIECINRNLRP